MVTKKHVFIMVLVFLLVAATISAGVMRKGNSGAFEARTTVTATVDGDDVTRPIQRWQTLDAETFEECPLYGEDFDTEAFLQLQEERATFREEMQSNRAFSGQQSSSAMGRRGQRIVQGDSARVERSPMNKNNSGASFGPARAR